MLLPLLGWCVTGFIFFLKPGYAGAYEFLQIKTYPLDEPIKLSPNPDWLEIKYLKTILGDHLLVRTLAGWQHLDPMTRLVRNKPSTEEITKLLTDALSQNAQRYGRLVQINSETALTDTGVMVTLNWEQLRLQQKGKDTALIDRLYKIHYLQWTGIRWIDMTLGIAGLVFLVTLSVLGLFLSFNLRLPNQSQNIFHQSI